MKIITSYGGLLICFFLFSACGKKKNEKLAQTYYKMSLLEVTDEEKRNTSPQHKYTQALLHIEKALEQEERPEYYALKATLLFNLGHHQTSKDVFEKALACRPSPVIRAEILNNYACVLAQMNNIKQAQDIWQELAQDKYYVTPEVAYFNRGKIALTQKNPTLAQKLFTQATNLAPNYVDAHYSRALAFYQLKNYKQAQKTLQTVLLLEPTHHGASKLQKMLHKT